MKKICERNKLKNYVKEFLLYQQQPNEIIH